MLAEHPDICARLRQEIMEVVGPDRRPSLEEIRPMKFLRAFINGASIHTLCAPLLNKRSEVLRLYPAVYVFSTLPWL